MIDEYISSTSGVLSGHFSNASMQLNLVNHTLPFRCFQKGCQVKKLKKSKKLKKRLQPRLPTPA